MAGSAISAAASSLGGLATREASFLCGVHEEVELLREDLRSMQAYLMNPAAETQRGSDSDTVAADSVRRIRGVAYEAENIIDKADYMATRNTRCKGLQGAMTRYVRKPGDLVALHRLGKDILRVRRRIQDIRSSREFLDVVSAGGRVAAPPEWHNVHRASLSRSAATCDDPVVGFEGDVERIVERLKDPGNLQLTVVSIVAMGGAGKTTLARKACSSVAVKEHFDAFAFVSISQQFEPPHVLKEITAQAMGIKREGRGFDKIGIREQVEELEKMGGEDLKEKLHNLLRGKRYLIVLDDVWKMDTWDVLQQAFPDMRNGSRVMLTTRSVQVANQANKLTYVHKVRLLSEQESWQLFSLKAFPSYENIDASNRQDLETVGKNLVKKCNGLPLALVVLGSHLSKDHSLKTWLKMDRCLHWEVTSKWDNMQRIIARSYDDLPSHYLKSCFLYMVSFPEDCKICTVDLTRPWIAEGFVPHRSNQTPEEITRDCLEELAQRSMIHIHSRDEIDGWIYQVQIHDVVREWAVQQARKEGFLKVCKGHGDGTDGLPAYRLSFLDFFDDRICISATNTRSLLGFGLSSVTLGTLRFLRILYMSDSNLEKVSKLIGCLIHLRYIGLINCKNVVLPSSIGRLLNLQSIDLTGTSIRFVPKSLWDIPTLKHVEIPKVETINPTNIRVDEQSCLRTLYVSHAGCHKSPIRTRTRSTGWTRLRRSLMRMTQLSILVLISSTFLPVDVLTSLSNHGHLHLLALSVWESMPAFPDSILLPQNLHVLFLTFPGTWNMWHADLLPTLGRLQSLVNLTLMVPYRQDDADNRDTELISQHCQKAEVPTYEAPIVSSPPGGFPQLRYMNLQGLQAKKLRFKAGTMPKLVRLSLGYSHMATVPEGLLDLPSLEKLELYKMVNELPRETHELLESKGITVAIRKDE
ncbi:unnamed protein product [Urochloa humidicola]